MNLHIEIEGWRGFEVFEGIIYAVAPGATINKVTPPNDILTKLVLSLDERADAWESTLEAHGVEPERVLAKIKRLEAALEQTRIRVLALKEQDRPNGRGRVAAGDASIVTDTEINMIVEGRD